MDEVQKQREYYLKTASHYDANCCFDPNDEHFIATACLRGILDHHNVKTLADIGCGTGRSILYLKPKHPEITFTGVEPVEALRTEAVRKGLESSQVMDGDACALPFADKTFDCVTLFGVLHHIPDPGKAVAEAMRVSKKLIYISDHNIYGMGSSFTKKVKQTFRDLGLRRLLAILLTKGKGYHDTDWDGVFYPFSLVDYIPMIQQGTSRIYTFATKTPAINLYRDASHLAVLGVKND